MSALSTAGVIPVADGEEEIDEYVLEYLSGYIAECHASGEDCSTFLEVNESASPIPSHLCRAHVHAQLLSPFFDLHVSHASVHLPSDRDSGSCLRILCGPFTEGNQRQLTKSSLSYTALRQSRTAVLEYRGTILSTAGNQLQSNFDVCIEFV
jgi:hypothetical protein